MLMVIDPTAANLVVVAFAIVGMFVVVVFGVVYVAPFAWHMGRGAWYAAHYPAGPMVAANMLRDERALFDDARVAMVIGIEVDTSQADAAFARIREQHRAIERD